MNTNDILDRIFDYVAADYSNGERVFSADDGLLQNGIIDSQGLVNLVMFLEQEFSILIDDDDVELENFESVSSLTRFVSERLQN